jgi:hypothetical protein
MSKGSESYRLHYSDGLSWNEIAEELGGRKETVRSAARRYAAKHGLPTRRKQDGEDVTPGVSIKRSGNEIHATSYDPQITTVEQLIEHVGIDLDVYRIVKEEATAWTTAMRDIDKDIQFEDGAMSGHVRQSNDARFAQNIRVFVAAVPINPVAIMPAISPVSVASTFMNSTFKKQKRDFVRHLVFSDTHFGFRRRVRDAKLIPYHNRDVMDVIVQIAELADVDRVDILGDWFDMSEFTDKFTKKPEFYFTLQPAIIESFWWLQQFAAICSDVRLHEGNHDQRLPKAILNHLPFAYGLRPADAIMLDAPAVLSIENLLCLDKIGVQWIHEYPNDRDFIAERFALNHGLFSRSGPVETARAVARGYISEVFGHIHKEEHSTGVRQDASGTFEVEAWTFGCCCWTDYRVLGHKQNQEWSNGLGILDVYPDGYVDVNPISVRNARAAFNGQIIVARDRVRDLRKDVPEWNW